MLLVVDLKSLCFVLVAGARAVIAVGVVVRCALFRLFFVIEIDLLGAPAPTHPTGRHGARKARAWAEAHSVAHNQE